MAYFVFCIACMCLGIRWNSSVQKAGQFHTVLEQAVYRIIWNFCRLFALRANQHEGVIIFLMYYVYTMNQSVLNQDVKSLFLRSSYKQKLPLGFWVSDAPP